jgi:hypothetical protein
MLRYGCNLWEIGEPGLGAARGELAAQHGLKRRAFMATARFPGSRLESGWLGGARAAQRPLHRAKFNFVLRLPGLGLLEGCNQPGYTTTTATIDRGEPAAGSELALRDGLKHAILVFRRLRPLLGLKQGVPATPLPGTLFCAV